MRRRLGLGWMLAAVAAVGCGDDAETSSGAGSGSGGGATIASASSSSSTAGVGSTSGSDTGGGGAGEGGGGGAATALDIVWAPCPLYSDGTPGRTVECATIAVPSKWDEPGSEPIDFFVKRVPALEQPARAQVWYLQGGPGYAGDAFDPLADIYDDVVTDVDQYIPDHRGTGRSSRLGCSAEDAGTSGGRQITDAEWDGCLDDVRATWGETLEGFTMSNAARDVGEVIAATRAEGQQVVVFGGSYGSAWANRYLTLYPDQPTAVGMSALAVNTTLDSMDVWFNGLGERWMALCAADEVCADHLGPDPWATMTATLDALDDGSCPAITNMGFGRFLLQQIWASFFYGWSERSLIAPMVHRLARCGDEDVAAFEHLAILLTTPTFSSPVEGFHSRILSGVITLSEFWSDPPPSLATIDGYRETANVAHGLPGLFAAHYDSWPHITPDEHAGELAPPAAHMLLFSGELDFIPDDARAATIAHFESPTRPFLLLPRSSHVLGGSPVDGELPCGLQLVQAFIEDPEGTDSLDASCLERIRPIDFDPAGSAVLADYLGVEDPWDGGPEAARARRAVKPIPPIPWTLRDHLHTARDWFDAAAALRGAAQRNE